MRLPYEREGRKEGDRRKDIGIGIPKLLVLRFLTTAKPSPTSRRSYPTLLSTNTSIEASCRDIRARAVVEVMLEMFKSFNSTRYCFE